MMTGRRKWLCYALFLLQVFMAATGLVSFLVMDVGTVAAVEARNVTASCFGLLMLSSIFFSVMRSNVYEGLDFWFLLLVTGGSIYLYADELLILYSPSLPRAAAVALITLGYLNSIFLVFTYCRFCYTWYGERLEEHPRARRVLHFFAALACLLILGNIYGGYYCTFSPEGEIVFPAATAYFCYICPTVMLSVGFQCILRQRVSAWEKALAIGSMLYPYVLSIFMEDWTTLYFAVISCVLVFIYGMLYLRRSDMLAQKKEELRQSRLNVLRMQMNPHFIYNAFDSISSLCVSDPPAAREMIFRLTHYLRDNFTDLTQAPVRTFSEELRHIRQYLAIELVNYPHIKTQYDIEAEHFFLPCLSLQPLVENAIKHGIAPRRGVRGTLTLRSRETESAYIVRVEDDGVGFAGPPPDGGRHIGLQNVAQRVAMISGGRLSVKSEPDKGTVCELVLPKEETEGEA